MMRVICYFICGAFLPMPVAWGTKSRLEALGQNSSGSFYIQDERNIFLNPAYIHNLDRRLSFEWGVSGTANKEDTVATPKGEGGWWDGKASIPFAIYLGNENEKAIFVRNILSTSLLKPDNTIDVTWGTNVGAANRFGFGFNYSKNVDETTGGIDRSETFAGVRAGAYIGDNLEFFGILHLFDEADGAAADGDDYKGEMGLQLNAIYKGEHYRFYGSLFKKGAEFTPDASSTSTDFGSLLLMAGVAHVEEFGKRSMIFYFSELRSMNMEMGSGAATQNTDILDLKLGLGAEGQVAKWLSLRGSVAQATLLNQYKVKATGSSSVDWSNPDTTSVACGMTLHFSGFKLDGSFGTSGGTLTGGNIMSRVAMSYVY